MDSNKAIVIENKPQLFRTKVAITCSVPGCEKKHWGKGYCAMHYSRVRVHGSTELPEGSLPGKCKIPGCENTLARYGYCRKHLLPLYATKKATSDEPKCCHPNCEIIVYAKRLCRKHYTTPITVVEKTKQHRCSVSNCPDNAKHRSDAGRYYCNFHQYRRFHRKPIKLSSPKCTKGETWHNWKGGISEYPDHYLFKKVRKTKLDSTDYKCELCGEEAKHVHHINKNKSDHRIENLMSICVPCHSKIHAIDKRKPKGTSRYKRVYGHTITELSKMFNLNIAAIHNLHYENKLWPLLNKSIMVSV